MIELCHNDHLTCFNYNKPQFTEQLGPHQSVPLIESLYLAILFNFICKLTSTLRLFRKLRLLESSLEYSIIKRFLHWSSVARSGRLLTRVVVLGPVWSVKI